MKHFKTISEFHQFRDLPKPLHPLLSVVNVEEVKHLHSDEPMSLVFDFYLIAVKRVSTNMKVKYGQQPFDFTEGTMSFMAPAQTISFSLAGKEEVKQSGWVLLIHPDFYGIRRSPKLSGIMISGAIRCMKSCSSLKKKKRWWPASSGT